MSKLKICQVCKKYTLKDKHCKKPTKQAGYKFIKVKSIKENSRLSYTKSNLNI